MWQVALLFKKKPKNVPKFLPEIFPNRGGELSYHM
jgi:hypothetical protein